MSYDPVIPPAVERRIDELVTRWPQEGLLDAIQAKINAIADNPVREMSNSGNPEGRPWAMGRCGQVYFQVAFRFVEGEQQIEILDVGLINL